MLTPARLWTYDEYVTFLLFHYARMKLHSNLTQFPVEQFQCSNCWDFPLRYVERCHWSSFKCFHRWWTYRDLFPVVTCMSCIFVEDNATTFLTTPILISWKTRNECSSTVCVLVTNLNEKKMSTFLPNLVQISVTVGNVYLHLLIILLTMLRYSPYNICVNYPCSVQRAKEWPVLIRTRNRNILHYFLISFLTSTPNSKETFRNPNKTFLHFWIYSCASSLNRTIVVASHASSFITRHSLFHYTASLIHLHIGSWHATWISSNIHYQYWNVVLSKSNSDWLR